MDVHGGGQPGQVAEAGTRAVADGELKCGRGGVEGDAARDDISRTSAVGHGRDFVEWTQSNGRVRAGGLEVEL